jgi:hypothetical protein
MYFHIPSAIDPGMGFSARSGFVHVYVKPPISTERWRLDELIENKERVRNLFVKWHHEIRGIHHGEGSNESVVLATAFEAR